MSDRDDDLVVDTTSGPVCGMRDRGVPNWRGVPYGRVEERFRPPVPVVPAARVDARHWGPVSWQLPMQLGKTGTLVHNGAEEREDCLNLNIWSRDQEGSRPVLVWLHAGARVYGCGSTPWIDVWNLAARHDAVVVTANYRLGMWGWVYLGGHDPAFADSANLAVLDQIMLLRWVRDNIAGFGGDPANVTVFGMSSGASDAANLLGAPSARGLFHKAAIYSGNAESPVPLESAVRFTDELIAAAGPLASTVSDLARLPNVGLRQVHRRLLERGAAIRYDPVVDGEVIPRPPLDSIGAGLAGDVSVLVSTTADEAGLYAAFGEEQVDHPFARRAEAYPDLDREAKVRMLTRTFFQEPAKRLLTAVHASGGRCWAQEFDYAPTTSSVARWHPSLRTRPVHGVDVAALFIDPEGTTGTETDRAVGAAEQRALMEFARDGRPDWPQWTPERRFTQRIAAPDAQ